MTRADRIARRKERRMEVFKQIMLMILKMIIDALGGGISLANKKVEEKLAASAPVSPDPKKATKV